MSATLIPTKTAGQRPPVVPPVTTTFDGSPSDDSWLAFLQDDVRTIIRHVDASDVTSLEAMLPFLDRRKKLVLSEIWAYEATEGEPTLIPPFKGLPIDYLIERPTREQRILQSLLNLLDECQARCERRLARHRLEVRLSRDLGTSDS